MHLGMHKWPLCEWPLWRANCIICVSAAAESNRQARFECAQRHANEVNKFALFPFCVAGMLASRARVAFAGGIAVAASAVRALSSLEQHAAGGDSWLAAGICDNSSAAANASLGLCNDTLANLTSGNETHGAAEQPDSLTDVIFMAVTSVILGLMILITVIGKSCVHKSLFLNIFWLIICVPPRKYGLLSRPSRADSAIYEAISTALT
jgi:hypothetical protein